jgi:hypothetical protein
VKEVIEGQKSGARSQKPEEKSPPPQPWCRSCSPDARLFKGKRSATAGIRDVSRLKAES